VVLGTPPVQINGTIYNDDSNPIGAQAQNDLTDAYLDAQGRFVDRITMTADIGSQKLAPGLYWSGSSLGITGDLTLDAGSDTNAVWIFQIGSTLITAAGAPNNPASRVILTGGAQARNVFWQVGASATLGTYSIFKGTVMAHVSITMDPGSAMEGRALAQGGAVTFNAESASLPVPEAPRFTSISRTAADRMTVVVGTTPFLVLRLDACPDLLLTNWTTLATATPVTNPWTFNDDTATPAVPQRFYRAALSPY